MTQTAPAMNAVLMFCLLAIGGSTATAIIYVLLRALHSAMRPAATADRDNVQP